MAATILRGKPIADRIKAEVASGIKELREKGVCVCLAAIQVGDDPASAAYIRSQKRSCERAGIEYVLHRLPESTTQDELIDYIHKLNEDDSVTAMILQMPLPRQINANEAFFCIDSHKDAEGVSPASIGRIAFDMPRLVPPTAQAAVTLVESTGEDLTGKEAVVIGRSTIVGKPAALLLLQRRISATVTVCHTGTFKRGRIAEHVSRADILIAAVGQPELIKGDWIKPGAIVIDVGMNQVGDRFVGDVQYEVAKERAAFITPVPGGVGPVTVSILLKNVLEAARWRTGC